jgi:nitrogen-specific signal transduction histidine kinase/CheY-like chemotaxis protein
MLLDDEEIGRVWNFRDISDQKRAEKEREKLQSQLLQSQKLEAVGILAGGVAHDFNNMLGAIIGYAELTLDRMDAANPFRKNLSKILDAARRSTDITRQLLTFARKQTISPVVFDLNGSVEAILKMIRRLIGENIDLAWLPGAGRFTVKMDPSQLDQIILNLCVNARDAIGGVGRITIETDAVTFNEADYAPDSGVSPGEYVLLLVSDTGCGMGKETLAHIFEPFFTTKGLGQGTGMGLAIIYGIVQQNKGVIKVYSEPGTGTIFKIYIPMHPSEAETKKLGKNKTLPLSRGETVLIVEDDSNFLEMTAMMLKGLGYSILSAQTPSEALRLAQADPSEIHLFITDVIMPEMNGRRLAEKLSMIRPKIKHLFMSGYTADVIAHQGVLDEGINFIQKPFMLKDLAVKIRGVLG